MENRIKDLERMLSQSHRSQASPDNRKKPKFNIQENIRVITIDGEDLLRKSCGNAQGEHVKNSEDVSLVSFGMQKGTIQNEEEEVKGEQGTAPETFRCQLTVTQEAQNDMQFEQRISTITNYNNNEGGPLSARGGSSGSPMKQILNSIRKRRYQMKGASPMKRQESEYDDDENDEDLLFLDKLEEEETFFQLRIPDPEHVPSEQLLEEASRDDGKISRLYADGRREVVFPNGVKRQVWPDGYSLVYFTNGDLKQTFPHPQGKQRVLYYFSEQQTTQTTYPNGLQVFRFANRQLEKHFPDGTKEITFPDGTLKCVFPDTGEEESIFPDGTIQRTNKKTGISVIEFGDGTRVSHMLFL